MRVQYSIVLVSDMARSVAFYRDVVGLPLKFETPGWTEFATEGATFALHPSQGRPAADGTAVVERAGSCRPGFQVPDIDAFHARMLEHRVPCTQEPTEVFGVRIAQYVDPDGLVFGIGEERGGAGT